MTTTASSMFGKLVELPLGATGLDYVRSTLRGETSFCQDVLPTISQVGSVFTVVPEGTSVERAVQFELGNLVSTHLANRWLTERMISLSRDNPNGVLVFDEPWGGRKGGQAVMARQAPKFFHKNFVYHFVEANEANETSIDAAMRAGAGFLFVAAFSLYPFSAGKLPADFIIDDDRVMREIAAETQEIYISAYDHESYVVWRR